MPSIKISKDLNDSLYFCTLTVKNWYYLFDRHHRWEILIDSLQYCQKHKGVKIYAYVFMLNHLHCIIQSPDVSGFLRDFKSFTSKKLKENILSTEPNILNLFQDKNGKYEFWKKTNMPKIIENEKYFLQKKAYIENNPVRKQYVKNPEDWIFSSANPDSPLLLSDSEE
jgi:putative transposase